MTNLTAEKLREILAYDQETGDFVRLVDRSTNARAGSIAGCVSAGGTGKLHWQISIDGRLYYAHRLAWLYMTGQWPSKTIDHIDANGLNNRWSNLREATKSENQHNRGKQRNNTSGFKGVSWHKRDRKWQAEIWLNGRKKSLGGFDDAAAAHAAYCDAAQKFHGGFARVE
jgi:hypothetical protein